MIPNNITKEHLESAINKIKKTGIAKKRESSKYNLIYEGIAYPPKLVISISNKYANGTELDSNNFSGGEETNSFLEKRGFVVSKKDDPVKLLIKNYKKRISQNHLEDEVYKWKLVKKYNKCPDTDADDFSQEIKAIKFSNLIFHMGAAVVKQIAHEKPEELRQLFNNLFDENIDLTQRVKAFNEKTLKLYRDLGETLSHHQDERSIATYLTFHNSNKYTFYKYSFYKKYCKLLGVKEAKKNEKYTHYLELISDLIENYIIPDKELIEQVKGLIPDYYDGSNHDILAQDILYQMLDQKPEINYWLFQGNPKVFDFETALKENLLTDWTVSAHKDKIKVGDKVILWISGDYAGCYALAEVISEPHKKSSSPDDHLWIDENKNELKADIKITHNLVDSPILKEGIMSVKELNNLKVGNQGTNFSSTEEEYDAILKLIKKLDPFEQIKRTFDEKIFANYIQYLQKMINELDIHRNDERVVYSVRDDRLNFTIGQRYCFNLFRSNTNGIYGVISKDKLLDDSELFSGIHAPYYNYYQDFSPSDADWISIIESMKAELARTSKSGYRKYNNLDFEDYIFENILPSKGKNMYPLNTILYGPPGTGKTYHTINTALEIIDSEFYENNKNNRDALNEKFEEYRKNGQVVFITFHQSYGYEEFIEGIRANTNDDTISYSIEDGSFKLISDKALENYKNHQNYLTIGSHEKQVNIELLMNDYSNYVSEELEKGNEVSMTSDIDMHNKTLLGSVNRVSDGSFKSFYTSGSVNKQSLTRSIIVRDFQNFINGEIQSYQDIEPRYDSQSSYHGNAIYYFELYSALKSYLDQDEVKYILDTDEVNLKKFVLIIDEINRGNISKIFGELITLIESNKRLGLDESASIALPYSQESFTVPNNLYLVGTMNTADRSIALLDTALRRRFEFIEMMPDHTLGEINTDIEGKGINLQKILKTINERIEYLYDRDHTIGHSYFMGINTLDELNNVMKNKIIPLLQEYFYDDWEKIQIVLGDHYRQLGESKDADDFDDEINKLRFVQSERKREKNVLGFNHEDIEDEQIGYRIRNTFKKKTYKKIYEQIDIENA